MRYNHHSKSEVITIDRKNYLKNYITSSGIDWQITYISDSTKFTKGAHSSVFKLVDPNGDNNTQVIKFCNYPLNMRNSNRKKLIKRFEREIEAMNKVKELNNNKFILKIESDGTHKIGDKEFRFYTMEKASDDLGTYLTKITPTIQQRVLLCDQILNSLSVLHEMGIYHRDIKPDNIFFIDGIWKIGDLGLIGYRDEDTDLDKENEKIGPFGYMSPEAMNKFIGNRNFVDFQVDCTIDEKSDVFQLGMVFWYILQGEIPVGQLEINDLRIFNDKIFNQIIVPMLHFSKERRAWVDDIKPALGHLKKICGA